MLVLLALLQAQAPTHKAVWEPVSFGEDIAFREVFFATIDKGWVAGEKGTILHTRDGGATWVAQLGGDPQAPEEPVTLLRFLDETHGWAVKAGRILRTEDGESWEDLGAAPQYIHALAVSSPTEAVAAGYLGMGRNPSTLLKTRDGGRTWKPVAACAVKALVQGLTRELGCEVIRIQFVTPAVGWLVARYQCAGAGCTPPPILGRTEDGGESWRFFVGPGNPDEVGARDFFFTGEQTGIVETSDGKLSFTSDGGATWKGLLASVYSYGSELRFADPEVGWALDHKTDGRISYTVDGGAHWNSRAFRFPSEPTAWSFPRRDRAYVVGDHGMVFRYRIVPLTEAVAPGAQPAPLMPAFVSPLDAQTSELTGTVQELSAAVDRMPDTASIAAGACCGKPLNRFNLVLGEILKSLPDFVARFRNTNLLVAGLRMLVTLPAQLGEVRNAFRSFQQAGDKSAAQQALGQLRSAASSLQQSTKAAFQKEVTAP